MKRRSNKTNHQDSLLPKGIKYIRTLPRKNIVNVSNSRYPIIAQICRELNYQPSYDRENAEWDIMWRDTAISIDFLAKMRQYQKVNHFPGMSNLSRKALLTRNLKRMQNAFPDSYAFFPLTFVLPQDIANLNKFQDRARLKGQRPTFIIKPEVGCQGKGIYLWQSNIELQSKTEVVQLYIERPLLYKGLKFDLRVYVLVTGCNPLRLYIFNQGLVRLATETYQRPNEYNIEDLQMHLTNYSINKTSQKYIYNDSVQDLSKGHKKSLAQFFRMLMTLGFPADEYWSSIKDIAVKTLITGVPWLKQQYQAAQPSNKQNTMCFQILGLDFLIEDNHKIHLLEINHTPSFNTDTPLDYLVKSSLIKDTLQIVKKQQELRKKYFEKSNKNSRVRQKQIIMSTSDVTFSQKRQFPPIIQVQQDPQLAEKYLGSFERIYPNANQEKQLKYSRLLSYSISSTITQKTPKRKKISNQSNSRKRVHSQIKNIAHQTNELYYPAKQKIKVSKLLRPQISQNNARGLQRVFDRQSFKQQIYSRNNRRRSEYQEQEIRGETQQLKSSAAQLRQILQYHHQKNFQTPHSSSQKEYINRQPYT